MANIMLGGSAPLPIHDRHDRVLSSGGGTGAPPPPTTGQLWPR